MKQIKILLLSFYFFNIFPFVHVDFDASMQADLFNFVITSKKYDYFFENTASERYHFFKQLYERNNFTTVQPSDTIRIPKIIHQIWIGPTVPKELQAFAQTWQMFHPEWQYVLWTDKDIHEHDWINKDAITRATNPGEIADLMRLEILYKHGGVYVDMDFECIASLDELHYFFDFYIGLQPLDCGVLQLANGLIGSIPYHPLLKKCIEEIGISWAQLFEASGLIQERTGPLFLTKLFIKHAGKQNLIDVALPAHYFYPLGATEYLLEKEQWVNQGSYGVHYWAKMWLKAEFRRKEFQHIKNY